MTATVGISKAAKEFVRYSNEPWVIVDGKWWHLNPNRPDFSPRAGSKLEVAGSDRVVGKSGVELTPVM